MCDVCCANMALDGNGKPVVFGWANEEGAPPYGIEVEATGEGAEFQPAQFRVRRHVPETEINVRRGALPAPWSPWFATGDLAGVMARLGLDIKWVFVDPEVQAWVNGGGFDPVQEILVRDTGSPSKATPLSENGGA